MPQIQIEKESVGKRVDIVLTLHPSIASRSIASKLIRSGQVKINGSENITTNHKTRLGDIIEFEPILIPSFLPEAVPYDLPIVFEDDDILIINKPKGMVVHPAPGHRNDTLVNYLLYHGKVDTQMRDHRPGIVHRLDKDTSGLLVVAKNEFAMAELAKQFADHSISRVYVALVWGKMENKDGTIEKPLGRHPVNRKKWAVVSRGKYAVTHWTTIKQYLGLSLIECRLETGRSHQIRVHMHSIGHSLVGDPTYGKMRKFSPLLPKHLQELLESYPGQALHAKTLGFIHPRTCQPIEFKSALPNEFKEIIEQLDMLA